MSQSDEEEEEEHCPLCCETLDITDRNFFPCPCEYQVWGREGEREGLLCVVWSVAACLLLRCCLPTAAIYARLRHAHACKDYYLCLHL